MITNWSLTVLPGNQPSESFANQHAVVYQAWHEVWASAFKEADIQKPVFSDEFTRQDDVIAVFEEGRCLLCLFFRTVDLSTLVGRSDSYFSGWTDTALNGLQRDSSVVCVGSNTTVVPFARGNYKGFSLKNLLAALAVQYFVNSSPGSAMTAAMRNRRGMNVAGKQAGATLLDANVPVNGEPTDLMAFFKNDLVDFQHPYQELASQLWSQRQDWRNDGDAEELSREDFLIAA